MTRIDYRIQDSSIPEWISALNALKWKQNWLNDIIDYGILISFLQNERKCALIWDDGYKT